MLTTHCKIFAWESSKSPYSLSDRVEFIFLHLSFLIKDIDQKFCDFDQQKPLSVTLQAEM